MLNKTWLGIAIGGGASVLYGKAGYILQFLNLEHLNNSVSCAVGGVRMGAALHASCGFSFALMTGVPKFESYARKLMVWMPPPEGITMCQVSS